MRSDRIQARAIRRCGELLKQIEPKPGKRTDKPSTGTDTRSSTSRKSTRGGAPPSSRSVAGRAAGLSRDQQRDALRVASVPKRDFERQVEAEAEQLAEEKKPDNDVRKLSKRPRSGSVREEVR